MGGGGLLLTLCVGLIVSCPRLRDLVDTLRMWIQQKVEDYVED